MCWNDKIWKDKSLVSLLAKKYTLLEYCQGMGFFEYWLSTFTSQELESNLLWSDYIDYFIVLGIGPS